MDKTFISYEYTQIPTNHKQLHFLLDCYEGLGWEQDTRLETDSRLLTLRRSRKLANHMELTRLQGHLEACLHQIEGLEKSKGAKAVSAALMVGLGGTILTALSVFAITAPEPRVLLCVLLGIPGIGLWALAPVLHKKLYAQSAAAADALILKKRDEIFEICEKGSKLL